MFYVCPGRRKSDDSNGHSVYNIAERRRMWHLFETGSPSLEPNQPARNSAAASENRVKSSEIE